MTLTFANFKKTIPSQVLTRGRAYYRDGQVTALAFDEDENVWEAQVEGNDLYEVRVEQGDSGQLSCSCTCPYDMGEHCKHIAAVLYAVEAAFPDQIIAKPRRAGPRKTKHDKLRERLAAISHEKLVTGLLELAAQDRALLNQLLLRFDADAKPTDYRRVVKDALRAGRGDHGYLDYIGSQRAADKIDQLLAQARLWTRDGEPNRAVSVYYAVLDEVLPAMSETDDESGALSATISTAIEQLGQAAGRLDPVSQQALFDDCLARAERPDYLGWDWGWDLLSLAAELVDSPARRAAVFATLDRIEAPLRLHAGVPLLGQFTLERVAEYRLAIIERLESDEAVEAFLRDNTHVHPIRVRLIERAMARDQVDDAMRLIQDGIAASQRNGFFRLVKEYQDMRIDLLKQGGDPAALIAAARASWLQFADPAIYALLKQQHSPDAWGSFLTRLIADIGKQADQLAWVYAEEGRWDDLLALIQGDKRQGHWLIEQYREPLEQRYPAVMADYYETLIWAILKNATGRREYQMAVEYLKRIRLLTSEQRAQGIATRAREQYPKRRALHDELGAL